MRLFDVLGSFEHFVELLQPRLRVRYATLEGAGRITEYFVILEADVGHCRANLRLVIVALFSLVCLLLNALVGHVVRFPSRSSRPRHPFPDGLPIILILLVLVVQVVVLQRLVRLLLPLLMVISFHNTITVEHLAIQNYWPCLVQELLVLGAATIKPIILVTEVALHWEKLLLMLLLLLRLWHDWYV